MTKPCTYLRDAQLAERFNVSKATIWLWSAKRDFPSPVKLSPGCTRWRLSDVERWEAQRAGRAA